MRKIDTLKNIGYCFFIILFAFLFVGIGLTLNKTDEEHSFSVSVQCGKETEELKLWRDKEKREWFVFLPSDTAQIFIPGKQKVQISGLENDNWIKVDESLLETPHQAKIDGKNETVRFLRSSGIPSLFISTESGSMEKINANKNNYESGFFHIVSSDESFAQSGALKSFHGRGNTSWQEEKKGYSLEMEEPRSLLGLKKF